MRMAQFRQLLRAKQPPWVFFFLSGPKPLSTFNILNTRWKFDGSECKKVFWKGREDDVWRSESDWGRSSLLIISQKVRGVINTLEISPFRYLERKECLLASHISSKPSNEFNIWLSKEKRFLGPAQLLLSDIIHYQSYGQRSHQSFGNIPFSSFRKEKNYFSFSYLLFSSL